jgi:hypothetical protein
MDDNWTRRDSGKTAGLVKIFSVPEGNVRVIALFIGGGFGCKGEIWSHLVLASMAARQVQRPVKLVEVGVGKGSRIRQGQLAMAEPNFGTNLYRHYGYKPYWEDVA